MQFPIVREFKTDITASNPENKVTDEPRHLGSKEDRITIIVPRSAPFFVRGLEVKALNGKPLVPEKDYRIYRLMSRLTQHTGQPVACAIEILNEAIEDVVMSYHVVGEFSLIDNGLLQLIEGLLRENGPVDWFDISNKPVVFNPELHTHSLLYTLVGFQDFIDFIDLCIGQLSKARRSVVEIQVEHYTDLLQHYIAIFKKSISDYLERHKSAYNSHGITAAAINLDKVDNYETARGGMLRQSRTDLHVVVSGLRSIIESYSFNGGELLEANTLPISRFGNTNFIPPSIDGSFEGLGGLSETAGISMESDGSLVFLENRYDGRVDGLYFSVIKDFLTGEKKRVYSGYRYTHQRIESDGATVNRIAAGSGDEVILVADADKNIFYVGLTNGSLDPAKHVLSRVDLSEIMTELPTGQRASDHIPWMQVMLAGDWIYISIGHTYVNRGLVSAAVGDSEKRFRYYYKVAKKDVESQLPVKAALQRLTYTDPDGINRRNVDYFRFYTPVGTWPNWTRCWFPIRQTTGTVIYGNCYSQHCLTAPIPNKPGKVIMKIIGSFLGSYASGKVSNQVQIAVEATYEFDPDTGVMDLLHKTPQPTLDFTNPFIDWLNSPPNWRSLYNVAYGWDRQGLAVLPDGTIAASTGDFASFPRGCYYLKANNAKDRYDILSRQWNTGLGAAKEGKVVEPVVSPLVSGIKPKSFLLGNGGDFYTADSGVVGAKNKLYYRAAPGGLAARTNIQNKMIDNIRSRPLSNKVWEVRGEPKIGGATITVPSSRLATYGTDLGDFSFCVGTTRQYLDLPDQSAEWTQPADMNTIKLVTEHTTRINSKGLLEIVPTATITYPSDIVDKLRREVDSVTEMLKAPDVIVVVCDPTGSLADRFGWLPVLVWISWGRAGTTERHDSMICIEPTYSGTTHKVVTGYSVNNRIHNVIPTGAVKLTPEKWDGHIAGDTNYPAHGSMRVGYYLNGSTVSGYFDSGVSAEGQGDTLQIYGQFKYYSRSTKRWSTTATDTFIAIGNGGGNAHKSVAPDLGVVEMHMHAQAAGGAATIFKGSTYNPMLGSVYPETGWSIFFQGENSAVFNGKAYTLPPGLLDLRDISDDPTNKTFYIYAVLREGVAVYEVGLDKRLESPFQLWVGTAVTNQRQILTLERYNVFAVDGHRVSDIKRGNSIPASTGLVDTEGQFPWLKSGELLP